MKKLFLTFVVLLFAFVGTMKATDVTIGSFSSSLGYIPTYTYYNYSVSEQIYTADEIGMDGNILAISFYRYSGSADRNLMIYMAEVEEEDLSAGWINLSSSDLVFSGNTGTGTGWITLELDNEFEYSGEGNLLVCVNDVTGSYVSTNRFVGFAGSTSRFHYNDNNAYDVTNLSSGYTYAYRNYINLTIKGAADITVSPNPIALGYRPNGYWMEPVNVTLTNGGRAADVTLLESDNAFFEFDAVTPFSLDYLEEMTIQATTGSAAAGEQTGNLVIAFEEGRAVTTIPMSATAYNASSTDVWELAEEVSVFPFQAAVATSDNGIQKNYNLLGSNNAMKDVVYKVNFDGDVLLNAGATDGVTAIYTEDFNGQEGPKKTNVYNGPVIGHGGDPGANVVSGDWYYYGDDEIATNIGAGGAFHWAVMFPAGTYTGSYVTKVAYFDEGYPFDGSVTIYNGGTSAPNLAVGTMEISVPGDGSGLNELEFATPVAIDETQNLWVVFYNATSTSYPATATYDCGDANARWVEYGGTWSDLASLGLPGYSWMLRAYVQTGLRGEVHEITVAEQPTSNAGRFYATGNRGTIEVLNEGFEGGEMPDGWTVEGTGNWTVGTGDYSTSTGAANGTYNARATHATSNTSRYLITPAMDLSEATSASVSFNYVNRSWGGDIDGFSVCYRVDGGAWTELFSTTAAHATWTAQNVTLSGLAANYQIGFCMNDKWGYGVGLDDVIVTAAQPIAPQYQINDMFVQAGTYYLVFASATDDFQVDIMTGDAPAPGVPVITYPVDGDNGIDNPVTLAWNLGDYTGSMKVLLGTQYPPTDVLVDWTQDLISDYVATSLMHNKTYFMQVFAANANDTVASDIVGFTTALDGVTGFAVETPELYPGDSAVFTWTANRTFRGYNMYQDGVKLNDELITATTYAVNGLEYNMADGYAFQISAVYSEGESVLSDPIAVNMTGFGTVSGTVYEQDGTTVVASATVTLAGTDEYGNNQSFTYTTDENGNYTGEILAGSYRASAIKTGYQNSRYDGTVEIVFDTETSGIDILLYEEYYPLGQITATEQPDENNVLIEWNWTPGSLVVDFETGDFSQADFDNSVSSYPWAITTTNAYEGTYAIKSTCEGIASATSAIEATVDVPFDAMVGFYVKVSSEANYDKFFFYIDGVQQGTGLSGSLDYQYKEYAVSEGTHTYRWEYTKDGSVNNNDDCAYVDNITMYMQAPPAPSGQLYNFDNGSMMGWTSLDANNDGYGWVLGSEIGGIYLISGASLAGSGHDASADLVCSGSYSNATNLAITPDNYLVAPNTIAAQNGAVISFWACAQDASYAAEHFGVAVSTGSATAADFNTIQEWTMTAKGTQGHVTDDVLDIRGTRSQGSWYQYTVDLSAYAGQNIWVAIRHFNCNDQFILNVDDITLGDGTDATIARGDSRSLNSYNLYRRNNNEETPVVELIASPAVSDTAYVDNDWADLPFGVYQWGIQAYYEGNAPTERNRDEFTVYEGTATNNYVPLYGYYADAYLRCQYVMEASELADIAGTEISAMTFAITSPASAAWTAEFQVYMTEVSYTSISEFIDPATATVVYTGLLDGTGSEMTVTFDSPYYYGGGNLLIGFDDITPGNYKACTFAGSDVEGACVQGYSYSSVSSVNPTQRNFIPQTTFSYEGGGFNGLSTILWSNEIEKDMYTTVTVNVALNNGQSPAGASVALNNNTMVVDETGTVVFENVRKGDYTLAVTKDEFNPYSEDFTFTEDAYEFNVVLEETIGTVTGLYVSPTGWAMWDGPMPGNSSAPIVGGGSTSFTEDFEGGLNGWTVLTVNTDGGSWIHSDNNLGGYTYTTVAHGGTGFAMCYSYVDYVGAFNTDSYLITPEMYTITSSSTLHFWADNANDSYPENFSVCVSTAANPTASDFTQVWSGGAKGTGSNGATMRHDDTRYLNWREHNIDLSAYAGQNVWIAFHDVNYDMYEIWIDDVELNAAKGDRAPVSYKVMIDGTFEADCDYAFLQHNVEDFEEGSEHTTSVMAVYATGTSQWVSYDWVYAPCSNYEGATDVAAVQNGNDVTISWTLPNGTNPNPNPPGTGQWYYYGDDNQTTGVGAGGAFYWAVMFPAGSYTGNMVTKVANYGAHDDIYGTNGAFTGTVTIYNDGTSSPATPVGSMDISMPDTDQLVEFEFSNPVTIDPSKNLWVVFYNASSTDYVASACNDAGDPNGRWVSLDGSSWMDLASAGVPGYNWMIRVYVAEGSKGEVHEITVPEHQNVNPNGKLMAHRDYIFDQAQYVTDPGVMPGGADASNLQGAQSTFGPNCNFAGGYWLGDDFTLTADANINEIEVYGYQTGSTTTSTFTGLYLRIFDGHPSTGNLVWGDETTNRMTATSWTNCYRCSNLSGTTRPVMAVTASGLDINLPAGSYYLVWSLAGSGSSGPWGQPVAINGQTNTGNGIQYTSSGWVDLADSGSNDPYGMAFRISGTGGGGGGNVPSGDVIGAYVFRDGELLTGDPITTGSFVDVEAAQGEHEYCVRVVYNDFAMSCPVCVELEHQCVAVNNLQGEYEWFLNDNGEEVYGAHLTWECELDEFVQQYIVYFGDMVTTYTSELEFFVDMTNNPGVYTFGVVADYGYCQSEMVTVDVNVTNVNEIDANAKIYPNPTNANVTIEAAGMNHITVVSALGQMVYDADVDVDMLQLNLGQYKAGVYMVRINTENGMVVKRVTVVK